MKKTSFLIAILIISMLFTTACQKSPAKSTTSQPKSSSSKSSQQKTSSSSITSSKSSSIISAALSKISSSKISTSSKSSTISQPTGPIPIVFDDPLLETMLRKIAKKSTGNVMPSDLSCLNADMNVYFFYSPYSNQSGVSNSIDNIHENITGKVVSLNALSTVPLKNVVYNYSILPDKLDTTYNLDLKWFTDTGALEQFRIVGTHESSFENQHIQTTIISNFNSISKCANLKYLSLQDCKGVDLSGLSNLKNIESVEINNCNISSLDALKNMPKLSALSLTYNPNLTDLSSISGKTSIQAIELGYQTSVDITTLLSLPNLKNLELSHCPLLDENTKIQFSQKGITIREG